MIAMYNSIAFGFACWMMGSLVLLIYSNVSIWRVNKRRKSEGSALDRIDIDTLPENVRHLMVETQKLRDQPQPPMWPMHIVVAMVALFVLRLYWDAFHPMHYSAAPEAVTILSFVFMLVLGLLGPFLLARTAVALICRKIKRNVKRQHRLRQGGQL